MQAEFTFTCQEGFSCESILNVVFLSAVGKHNTFLLAFVRNGKSCKKKKKKKKKAKRHLFNVTIADFHQKTKQNPKTK